MAVFTNTCTESKYCDIVLFSMFADSRGLHNLISCTQVFFETKLLFEKKSLIKKEKVEIQSFQVLE